jgi:hypothetical protein
MRSLPLREVSPFSCGSSAKKRSDVLVGGGLKNFNAFLFLQINVHEK